MREVLIEFFAVISYSTKTQLAILFGLVFFVGSLAAGDYFASHFELHGPLAPMAHVIREKIIHRYDKAALAILIGFFVLAAKCYKKDRKRLLYL